VSGILDPGEEPAVGLAREVLEETAVEVRIEALAAVSTTPVITYPNGDRSAYLDLCFVARPVSPEAAAAARVADDESLEVAWFSLEALPDDVAHSSRERLDLAQRYLAEPRAGTIFAR
jgi:ADP-ribose pyrophosphatase YjhB (NUDIX family)